MQIPDDARHPYTRDLLAAPPGPGRAAVAPSQAPALVLEACGITAGYGPVGRTASPSRPLTAT